MRPIKSQKKNRNAADDTVEVLYQKMGDRWFAFSVRGDEVFVGSISSEELKAQEAAKAASQQDPLIQRKIGRA